MNKQRVIAVDHGNRNMKTTNYVFPSGHIESGHLPSLGVDVLVYNGKEYTIVDQRKPQKDDKTKDDDYFVSTLFAIGKELTGEAGMSSVNDFEPDTGADENAAMQGKSLCPQDGCTDIVLLVGLPPLHCKKLGKRFADYFKNREHPINFILNSAKMSIKISDLCN